MTTNVELFFDYASPWAYLANEIVPRKLPGVAITLRPVYLRGFASFAQGVPYAPEKMAYIMRDMHRCASHEEVKIRLPSNFPINGLYALRGALAAEKAEGANGRALATYHAAMFHAAWRDDVDMSKKDVVAGIARDLGLAAVAEELDAPWVKAELKARTEGAVARGLFGVPTFVVGDELFWGHDRIDYVARAVAAPTSP
jgi:2-hydroxychromene-2-carboxylate isomerase